MSGYIPMEIQEEILKRLPVKPLLQFRSVSKPWKGLIDSPDFINSYGVGHPQPDRFILRYKLASLRHSEDKYITLVDNDDDDSFVQQDLVPTIPDLVKKFVHNSIEVVGSSHGLLCFEGFKDEEMFVIWNPSIRKSVGIQVPRMYDFPNENFVFTQLSTFYGFGVCPATLDPTILKIKRICYKRKMEDMAIIVPWKVRVFTLSTGAWSILSTNLPRESVIIESGIPQVVINRFIYWVAVDELGAGLSNSKSLIMSFDLTTKEFKEINLSGSLSNPFCRILGISKLRESLVVFAYHKEFEKGIWGCSLWMMKEQGVNRSFSKLYNINTSHPKINRILGFRKTGELIILRQQQNAGIEIYDPNSEAIDNLLIDGLKYLFFMCPYMETLLLLDQLDGFIYSIPSLTDHTEMIALKDVGGFTK